uniref:Uncharacterized protein n=1 Tax=Cacopsylla melanoneura TaxID=428564 RepID=A0A8D9EY27_9HEMI
MVLCRSVPTFLLTILFRYLTYLNVMFTIWSFMLLIITFNVISRIRFLITTIFIKNLLLVKVVFKQWTNSSTRSFIPFNHILSKVGIGIDTIVEVKLLKIFFVLSILSITLFSSNFKRCPLLACVTLFWF